MPSSSLNIVLPSRDEEAFLGAALDELVGYPGGTARGLSDIWQFEGGGSPRPGHRQLRLAGRR